MRIFRWVLALALFGAHSFALAQDRDSVAAIRSACQGSFAKADRHYEFFFSALLKNDDPSHDKWKREASETTAATAAQNGNSTASVYQSDGRVAVVAFAYLNQFGDWVNDTQYCFRSDGTLAQIHSRFDNFHDDMTVVRDYFFSSSGEQIALERHDYALRTTQPKKPEEGFWDYPPPVFRRVSDLPFAGKLK